jgi:hypothetical protein
LPHPKLKFDITFNFRVRRVACRFLMEGFVSKVWLRRFFLALAMAAAAATPTGPRKPSAKF